MKLPTSLTRRPGVRHNLCWHVAGPLCAAVSLVAAVADAQLINEDSGDSFRVPYFFSTSAHGFQVPDGTGFIFEDGRIYSSNFGPRGGGNVMSNAVAQENGSTMNSTASAHPIGNGLFGGRNFALQSVSNASAQSGYYTIGGQGSRSQLRVFTPDAAAQRSVWRWRVTGTETQPLGWVDARFDFLVGRYNDKDFFYLFDESNTAMTQFGPGNYSYTVNVPLDAVVDVFFWCSAFVQVDRGVAPQGANYTLISDYTSTYELYDIDLFADQAGTQPIPEWTMVDVATNQYVFNQDGPLPPCTPPPANMIAWFAGEGSAADSSGNGNHGALLNGATTPLGLVGEAFSFDGNDDAVGVSSPALNASFAALTIDAWVKPETHGASNDPGNFGRAVVSKTETHGFALRLLNGVIQADLRLSSGNVLATFGSALPLNQWSHIAVTYDGSAIRAYVNGVQVGSDFPASGTITNTQNANTCLMIGHEPTNGCGIQPTFGFDGLIDEVELFNRALTQGELAAIVAAGAAGKCRPQGGITFTVNTTSDSADGNCSPSNCSLREAIHIANGTTGTDTIAFNIPGSGVQTIAVNSVLPALADPVRIDGYTQPGASANTREFGNDAVLRIVLSGANLNEGDGFLITRAGSGTTIRGLVINGFNGGIGFLNSGVRMEQSDGNAVEGCFIGTDATGSSIAPNTNGVFLVDAENNRIGGTTPAQRNLISGNVHYGVEMFFAADNNVVQGNYIGTNYSGISSLGNIDGGIHINRCSGNLIGGADAPQPLLAQGTAPNLAAAAQRARPVYSRAGAASINLAEKAHPEAAVRRPNGDVVIPPTYFNVISGNGTVGIALSGSDGTGESSTGNRILGNFIGVEGDTDPTTSTGLPNSGPGILVGANVYDTQIGETNGGGNFIGYNDGDGIEVAFAVAEARGARVDGGAAQSIRNEIVGNSIVGNQGLGIDLGGDGVTPNDPQDADSGPNDLQNFPELTSATTSGTATTVQGTINSTPNSTLRLEFFHSNDECNGDAEGLNSLGFITVTTNSNGNASFSFEGPGVAEGATITATATTTDTEPGSTSEFSACITAGVAPLNLLGAASRETHGSAGDFDVNLPLTGTPGVECRDQDGTHTLVLTFSTQVVSGEVSVTNGTATPSGSPTFSGNTMSMNFTGVADAQTITFTLSNVTDVFGQTLPSAEVRMTKLIGDTNGNGAVNAGDAIQTRNRSGQNASATTFRSDVNTDGTVNAGDSLIVRDRSGNSINP